MAGSLWQKGSKQMLQESSQASCTPPSTKAEADEDDSSLLTASSPPPPPAAAAAAASVPITPLRDRLSPAPRAREIESSPSSPLSRAPRVF